MQILIHNKNGHAMNENMPSRRLLAVILLGLMTTLSGCAVKGNASPQQAAPVDSAEEGELSAPSNHDPLEPLNRGIFKVNEVIDGLVLKPAAHIYLGVVPDPVRTSVKNALTNLSGPIVAINSGLQGDGTNMGRALSRFVINSTIGIAGIFDVASEMGIPKEHKKDFGQTMGVHGVGSGPYIQIPILGPSSARDALGMIADIAADPFTYILTTPTTIAIDSVRVVDRRADLLPVTDRVYRDSLDPYASIRSMYQQHREKVIRNYRSSDTAEVDTIKKK